MELLELFLRISIIIFPFGEIARIQFGNNIAISCLDIPVSLVTIIYSLKKMRNKKWPNSPLLKPISVFTFFAIVSLIANLFWLQTNQEIVAGLYLIRWITYAGIFFAVRESSEKQKTSFLNWLMIGGGVLLGVGYIQLFFLPSLQPIYQFGWDKHLYRMVSTFLDPNFFGTFLVLYMFLIVGKLQSTQKTEKQKKVALRIMAILTTIAIFLTYSRSAILCLIIAAIVYFLLINKKKLILGMLLLVTIAFLCILPFSHIENVNLLRVNSSKARLETWNNASKIFQKNILFGVGFNTYRYAQIKYNLRQTTETIPNHADAGSDNSLLFILATTGIFGFVTYSFLWGKLLERSYNKREKPYHKIFLASIAGLFISSLFINSLFFPLLMYYVWMIAGIIDSE